MPNTPRQAKGPTRERDRLVALIRELQSEGDTQTSIANKLQVHQTYIAKLLKGGGESIGAELIRRARDHIGVDVDYFYDDYTGSRSRRDYPRRDRSKGNAAVLARLEQLERAMSELRKDEPEEDPEPGSGVRRASSNPPPKE